MIIGAYYCRVAECGIINFYNPLILKNVCQFFKPFSVYACFLLQIAHFYNSLFFYCLEHNVKVCCYPVSLDFFFNSRYFFFFLFFNRCRIIWKLGFRPGSIGVNQNPFRLLGGFFEKSCYWNRLQPYFPSWPLPFFNFGLHFLLFSLPGQGFCFLINFPFFFPVSLLFFRLFNFSWNFLHLFNCCLYLHSFFFFRLFKKTQDPAGLLFLRFRLLCRHSSGLSFNRHFSLLLRNLYYYYAFPVFRKLHNFFGNFCFNLLFCFSLNRLFLPLFKRFLNFLPSRNFNFFLRLLHCLYFRRQLPAQYKRDFRPLLRNRFLRFLLQICYFYKFFKVCNKLVSIKAFYFLFNCFFGNPVIFHQAYNIVFKLKYF